jgi:hypothetical protein
MIAQGRHVAAGGAPSGRPQAPTRRGGQAGHQGTVDLARCYIAIEIIVVSSCQPRQGPGGLPAAGVRNVIAIARLNREMGVVLNGRVTFAKDGHRVPRRGRLIASPHLALCSACSCRPGAALSFACLATFLLSAAG